MTKRPFSVKGLRAKELVTVNAYSKCILLPIIDEDINNSSRAWWLSKDILHKRYEDH